ncbi:response regulator transcription factor [candidate division KSB1 bacterium]|nr:response regulator transcription factor [candidate division KSB1 bacterium]
MKKSKTVLLVEDDPSIVDLLKIHLKDLDFLVDHSNDGSIGLRKALENNYDLIILDIMLPGLDGLEICKGIRNKNKLTPILMLTAKSEELDKVLGLELGADDYLTKPFSVRELIARIKALFRRMEIESKKNAVPIENSSLIFDDLVIDIAKRKVVLGGRTLDLTAKEFDLLALFAQNPGKAYNRQQLLDHIWGYQFDGYDHTVNSHINRLRNKIEQDANNPKFIKTVWGVGYRFIDEEELGS